MITMTLVQISKHNNAGCPAPRFAYIPFGGGRRLCKGQDPRN